MSSASLCLCATCNGGASNPVPTGSNQTAAAGCAAAVTVDRGGVSRENNVSESTTVTINVKGVQSCHAIANGTCH